MQMPKLAAVLTQRFSRGNESASIAPEMPIRDGVLQVYDVIEEEHAYLAGGEHTAAQPRDWSVRPQHILDLADFARKLTIAQQEVRLGRGVRTTAAFDATRDVSRGLLGILGAPVGDNGAALRQALERYVASSQPGHQAEADLTEQLAGRINLLIQERDLARRPGFDTLHVDTYVSELRQGPPGRHLELNRLLFEIAYPSQLVKVRDIHLQAVYARSREHDYAALCLSGGGIRSATFSLGVVQGLARLGLLGRFRYLSTVSGGGYLGGWLSAWMMRAGATHVINALSGAPSEKLDPEPEPMRHLRAYGSFLSPTLGLLSADSWTLIATYLRNVWLNWLVSVPLLAAAVMVPYAALGVVQSTAADWGALGGWPLPTMLTAFGALAAFFAVRFVHANRPAPRGGDGNEVQDAESTHLRGSQKDFLLQCLLPLVLATVLLSTAWRLLIVWGLVIDGPTDVTTPSLQGLGWIGNHFALAGFVLVAVLVHTIGWTAAGIETGFRRGRSRARVVIELGIIVATSVLAGIGTHLAADQFPLRMPDDRYVVLAMPAFLALILLGSQLFLGISSAWSRDSEREWGARFNGWVLIVITAWMAFSWMVLMVPPLLAQLAPRLGTEGLAMVGGWSGLVTILLGRSAGTQGSGASRTASLGSSLRNIALALAAPVFAVSIIVLLSMLDKRLLDAACGMELARCRITETVQHGIWYVAPLVGLGLLGVGLLFGRLIDTNKFSLHAMYRARLIRAYLGASRPPGERDPDPFTGFDEHDNLRMQELWPAAPPPDVRTTPPGAPRPPLHVVNVALNLVGGRNLAWQERKAESFTFTSLHAGAAFTGYRRTSPPRTADGPPERQKLYGGEDGITLGTAVTISGAAANPNMGYHSSAAVTFLLTLFNARLGWWLGNPGPAGRESFHRPAPRLTAWQIMKELFGATNDRSSYVQLSDGGHFDNLGLYEMVLRRCRTIVVVDATADPEWRYDDLGNAIRKIRIDLGVPIEFDSPASSGPSESGALPTAQCAAATARIRYSCVDAPSDSAAECADRIDGVLIYLKPAMLGGEPRDVFTYKQQHPAFPHESTVDQFYSETQFESYRALGSYMVERLESRDGTLEGLAASVRAVRDSQANQLSS